MAKPDWITLSKDSGSNDDTVNITVPQNDGGYRECMLYVTGSVEGTPNEQLTKSIRVTQEPSNTRIVKVKVALVSYGYTNANTCELVYNIWLESDYTIKGGAFQATVSFKNPVSGVPTGKVLNINQGNTKSKVFSVSYQTPSLYDKSVRLTKDNVKSHVAFAAVHNGTSNDIDTKAITVEFVNTGILVINNKTIGEKTFIVRDEYNKDTELTFDKFGYLIVSWPYRGGLNICSYRCNVTTKVDAYTLYGIKEYELTLASRTFNTGTSTNSIKKYYDIWNCIQDEGYYPINSFKFTLTSSDIELTSKISNVTYINGNRGTGIISGEDSVGATLNSIATPIDAGLLDGTGYSILKFVIEGSSYDNKQICWYHDSPSSDQISQTIIRRLTDTASFNSKEFLETTLGYPIMASSNEVSASISGIRAKYTSTEKNMERFYNFEFITHPNTVL